jgi:hypothetical protein
MPVGPQRTNGTEARARETGRTGRPHGPAPASEGVSSYKAATNRDAPRWPKPDAGADRIADAGGIDRTIATEHRRSDSPARGGALGANAIVPSTHWRDRTWQGARPPVSALAPPSSRSGRSTRGVALVNVIVRLTGRYGKAWRTRKRVRMAAARSDRACAERVVQALHLAGGRGRSVAGLVEPLGSSRAAGV